MKLRTQENSEDGNIFRRTVRLRPSRSRMTHRVLVSAAHCEEAQLADSLLERDALIRCEFCSRIKTYTSQPGLFHFETDGGVFESSPDIEVTYVDGSREFLEVKYSSEYARPLVYQKYRRLRDLFLSRGMRYRVVTEKTIRYCATTIRNLRRLHAYRQDSIDHMDFRWIQPGKEYSFEDIAKRLESDTQVLQLIAHGKLSCDLSKLITRKTLVHISTPKDSVDFI